MARKKVGNNDISNKVVLVMLVVVVVISVASLGVYMNALGQADPKIASGNSGQLALGIEKPSIAETLPPSEAGGQLGIRVVK